MLATWPSAQQGPESQASGCELLTQQAGWHAETRRPAQGASSGPASEGVPPGTGVGSLMGAPNSPRSQCVWGPRRGTKALRRCSRAHRQRRPRRRRPCGGPAQPLPTLALSLPKCLGELSPSKSFTTALLLKPPPGEGTQGTLPAVPQEGYRPLYLAFLVPQPTLLASHPTPPAYTPRPAQPRLCTSTLTVPPTWSPVCSLQPWPLQAGTKGPPTPPATGHKGRTQLERISIPHLQGRGRAAGESPSPMARPPEGCLEGGRTPHQSQSQLSLPCS